MKILVTHINPHLDDIVAIWLFKKYQPDFAEAKVEFVSASRDLAARQETEDKIFLGTGGGKFDEHKEGLLTCAGSLVYEYLKKAGYIPEGITQKALEKLIEWNKLIDTGQAPDCQFDEFSIQSFIRCKDNNPKNSQKSVELGIEILERILIVLKRRQRSIKDWEKREEFESKFGKSVAVVSETVDREFCREQREDLFLMYHPKHHSVQFFAPFKNIADIYKKVKELDPQASWFLHQSHHMVICGSSSAPDSKPTKLSFEQLIEAAKSI